MSRTGCANCMVGDTIRMHCRFDFTSRRPIRVMSTKTHSACHFIRIAAGTWTLDYIYIYIYIYIRSISFVQLAATYSIVIAVA